MNEQYPLDPKPLTEAGTIFGYFSKGHHDFNDFAAEVERVYDCTVKITDCYHTRYRCVPAAPGEGYWLLPSKPGRGAFPVTVYE